jgi:hypothetical protein
MSRVLAEVHMKKKTDILYSKSSRIQNTPDDTGYSWKSSTTRGTNLIQKEVPNSNIEFLPQRRIMGGRTFFVSQTSVYREEKRRPTLLGLLLPISYWSALSPNLGRLSTRLVTPDTAQRRNHASLAWTE